MRAEIAEQPAMFARILTDGWPQIRAVGEAIRARAPRFVLFVARGTSDHAAIYAKYLVETRLPLPAGLVSPSTTTVYGARPDLRDVLYIGVSQSGGSPDLIEPLQVARAQGAITLAVTNTPTSPLAAAAEYSIDVLAGPERSVAATKSYTAELLTLYLLIEALAGRDARSAADLPAQATAVLAGADAIPALAARYCFAERLVTVGRGYNDPTAREAALKVMETSYLVAHAFSGADLLHGPMAIIERGFPVIVVAPAGPGRRALEPVLTQLRERNADLLLIGDTTGLAAGERAIGLSPTVDEALSPLLAIIPLQGLAWALARERGLDPDNPIGLSKFTHTR